jgi:hypothetical protein
LNGFVTAHMGMGQFAWAAYFLSPLLIDRVLDLIEGRAVARSAIWLGVLLFAVILQGAIHMMTWWLLLLGMLALLRRDLLIPLAAAVVIAISLYGFRVLPVVASFGDYEPEFIGGYRSVEQIVEALTVIHDYDDHPSTQTLGWFEYDMYLGVVGLGLLIYFGIYQRVKAREHPQWDSLNVPLIVLAVLSIGPVFGLLRLLPIPLIAGQRVTSRMLSVPLTFLIVMAAICMQRWLDGRADRRGTTLLMLLAITLMGIDLWQHLVVWSVPTLDMFFDAATAAPQTLELLGASAAVTQADQAYVSAVNAMPLVGAASLVIAAAVMFALNGWQRRALTSSPPES